MREIDCPTGEDHEVDDASAATDQIPAGWTVAQIRDLAADEPNAITDGPFGSNLKSSHYVSDGPRVIRLQNIGDGVFVDARACISPEHFEQLRKHQVYAGDIVIAALGEILPRACVIPLDLGPAIVKADCIRFKPDPRLTSAQYLNRALNCDATRRGTSASVHGVARPRLNLGEIRSIKIPLPPLAEQRRITEAVESLLARVETGRARLDRVPAILKRFRQSVLAAACSGRLTGDLRPGDSDQADDSLPNGWNQRTLGEIAVVGTGATPLRKRNDYYVGGTVPWVTSGAVNDRVIRSARECITHLALRETNAKVFPPGTLLVAMYGEGATRGKVAELAIPAATNQALAALVFDGDAALNRDYVRLFLEKNYDETREVSAGGVQPNLSLGLIRGLRVPLPPVTEQQEIVRRVEALFALADAVERRVAVARKQADALPQAILARAFSGRLVPTEAELARREGRDYEPASALLERIRQERSHSAGATAARRGRKPKA